jgi:hypothetical protein
MDTGTQYGDTPICRFPKNTNTGIRQHKKTKQKKKRKEKKKQTLSNFLEHLNIPPQRLLVIII